MNIQIMKTYNESFLNVRSHKMEWMKVAYAPILIWALGFLILAFAYAANGQTFEAHTVLGGNIHEHFSGEGSPFLGFAHGLYSLTYFIATTCLYINGYRYAILQEGGRSWITLNLNMRFVKMVLYFFLIAILGGIYMAISAGIIIGAQLLFNSLVLNVILGALLAVFAFYLLFRITLYSVAISIDQQEALKTSWRLMRGNVLRFLGLVLLISLTIALIGFIGALVLGLISGLFTLISPMLGILSLILWVLFGVFMTLLSWALTSKMMALVYQQLAIHQKS